MSRYGETALDRECAELARLSDGRHAQLCHATFALGQLVGAREIDRSEAERALYAAALACGYVKKRGKSVTEETIRTGLDKGAMTPRAAKHAAGPRAEAPAGLGPIKATYDYVDESGALLFQALRFERLGVPKSSASAPGPIKRNGRSKACGSFRTACPN
jgi:hypothetical protein